MQDEVPTYYHYNAHGDVVQLTNSSGTVTKDYTYDAFGVEKNASASDANPFRYCGEQYDDETGNYYLRARYYSPGVGRFTQEDTHWNSGNMIYGDKPLRLHAYTYSPQITAIAQARNLYFYALNNPIAYQDASGEDAGTLLLTMGTGSGGLSFIESLAGFGEFGMIGLGVLYVKSQIDYFRMRSAFVFADTSSTSSGGSSSKETSSTSQSAIDSSETAGGGPRKDPDKEKQLKSLDGKKAKEVARQNDYKSVEDFKRDYVGDQVSKFDLKYNPKTKEIFIVDKAGTIQIPTGLFK